MASAEQDEESQQPKQFKLPNQKGEQQAQVAQKTVPAKPVQEAPKKTAKIIKVVVEDS